MSVIRDDESESGDNAMTDTGTGIWDPEEEPEPTKAPKKSQV